MVPASAVMSLVGHLWGLVYIHLWVRRLFGVYFCHILLNIEMYVSCLEQKRSLCDVTVMYIVSDNVAFTGYVALLGYV